MTKKVLISTGGSGGHVIPAITIYNHLKHTHETLISTDISCLLYTSPSPRDRQKSRMPSSA